MSCLIRDLDFEHRNQLHVPIGEPATIAQRIGKDPSDLPLFVIFRPIQHIHGIPQMIGILRAQFQINDQGLIRLKGIQLKIERLRAKTGKAIAILPTRQHGRGGRIKRIRYAVPIIIVIKDIGRAILVRIFTSRARRRTACIRPT